MTAETVKLDYFLCHALSLFIVNCIRCFVHQGCAIFCDKYVCLFVYLENHKAEQGFCFCMLTVALCRSSSGDNCDALCTSGFVDDVMSLHSGPYYYAAICQHNSRSYCVNLNQIWLNENDQIYSLSIARRE